MPEPTDTQRLLVFQLVQWFTDELDAIERFNVDELAAYRKDAGQIAVDQFQEPGLKANEAGDGVITDFGVGVRVDEQGQVVVDEPEGFNADDNPPDATVGRS